MQSERLILRHELANLTLADLARLLHETLHLLDLLLVLLELLRLQVVLALGKGVLGDADLQGADGVLHVGDVGVALGGGDVVLVDDGAGADVLGLVGVAQRRERLVVVRRRDARDHGRLRVAAQAVLQQPGQDRVAVGHDVAVAALGVQPAVFRVGQGGDDAPEGREGFVDVGAFAQAGARGFGGFGAFGAGEVDEPDARKAFGGFVGGEVVVDLLQHDGEDGVGAGGGVVHLGRGRRAAAVAHAHVAHYLGEVFDGHVGQVFDVGAFGGRFAELEVVGGVGAGDEEVAHVLVVDFEVGDAHVVADVRGRT